MNNFFRAFIILIIFLFSTNIVFAVGNSAGLVNGIWFSNNPVTDFKKTIVYSVVHNQTEKQLTGIATYFNC